MLRFDMNDDQAREALRLIEEAASEGADLEAAARARDAVHALFASHHARIERVCRKFLGNSERAQDMTQDVFVTAWRRLGEWRAEGTFFSWLYGIARFKCMNALRRKADVLADDGILEGVALSTGPVTALRHHERLVLLKQAAEAVLDELERDVLRLRYEEGLGQQDITRMLGLTSKSGARGVLVRCRRKLDKELRRRAAELDVASSYFAVTR